MTLSKLLAADVSVPAGDTTMRSRHYLAWVTQCQGVATRTGADQTTRTTAHHVVKRGVGKKGPDWWSVPVSKRRHVHGKRSIDRLGKHAFLEEWGLPDWRVMALYYLYKYLSTGADEHDIEQLERDDVSPRPIDRRSARYYFCLGQRLLRNGQSFHGWTWSPPS